MSSVPYSAAANLSQQFRDYVYGPATQAEIDAARAGVSNQFRSSVYTGAPSGMDPVVVDPNTVSTGYGGARAAGANNYIYGYADAPVDANGNVISGVSAPYGPMDGGYRLNSPALDQQVRDAERQVFLEDAARLQLEMQLQADARNIGRPYGVSPEPPSSRGKLTGLLPTQIASALANYENGTYRGNPEDLYTDYFSLPQDTQEMVHKRYKSQVGDKQNAKVPTPAKAQELYQQAATQNAQAPRRPSYSGPPVSFPSYSGNPAGGYTNVTQLGPVNAGPVTITQNRPSDVGWTTGSSYDPNTGLSKWSTSGLTNGEMYYDNLYAGRFADEAARRQAQAASAAAARQRRAAGFERQDLINMVVDGMVADGMDRSMARVQARNMSENELGSYIQQAETAAANAGRDDQLNALLEQFSNPNYGSIQTPLPSYNDAGSQQTPVYTRDEKNAVIQAALNNPNLSVRERNQAILNAQRAYVASVAAQKQQQASAGTTGNVQQQYDQAVQQQSQMQQDLIQQYQDAMNQANAANQARYEDAIAGYQNMRDNISGYLDSQGQQAQEDINRQYDRFGASSDQDLMNRGLSNTTVRSSVQRGVEEDRGRALRNSQEQIDRQRLGFETTAQQSLLDFMERRTDQAPSYGDLANLAQGLGTAGGGTGGGSGTGPATSPTTGTGAVPSYTNPANGQQTGSGYNPIFNTDGQQQPSGSGTLPAPVVQQSAMGVAMAGTYGMQADGSYITPPDQRNVPGQGANLNTQAGPGGPVGGANISSGASVTNINPWTNPAEANKAGQIDPRQRSINMRSSGVAGIPSYNNQSTVKNPGLSTADAQAQYQRSKRVPQVNRTGAWNTGR